MHVIYNNTADEVPLPKGAEHTIEADAGSPLNRALPDWIALFTSAHTKQAPFIASNLLAQRAGGTAFFLAMRLLNTSSLTLEFFPSVTPQFAILSHRWEEEEVLYDDIRNGLTDNVKAMKGYSKIQQSCILASKHGYGYIWIDTCCIDKASSAELSESINSMFTWYRTAAVCYAYLSDIHPEGWRPVPFTSSQWFTRGWTLQELIAPSTVIFFNSKWQPIGTKVKLCDQIQERTGVPATVLVCFEPRIGACGSCSGGRLGFIRIGEGVKQCSHHTSQGRSLSHVLQSCSIAQRMSWAARRNTTRVEDAAYCLLGIFGVHMPLLYGEGMRAFLRLQEEIIKTTDDQSILAFSRDGPEWPFEGQDSLLAETPHYFADKRNISTVGWAAEFPMTPSSKTINMEMTLCQLLEIPSPGRAKLVGVVPDEDQLWLGILTCADATVHHDPQHPAIVLEEVDREKSIFRRVYSNCIVEVGFGTLDALAWQIALESRGSTSREKRKFICDGRQAARMNIHLLLMSKEPQDQEQQVSSFRFLSLAGASSSMQCCNSFPRPNDMRRGTTYSMLRKHEYNGYALCGILVFDFEHRTLAKERFWVFYGVAGAVFPRRSPWCHIASTATISVPDKRGAFLAFSDRQDEQGMKDARNYMWEDPRAWEWIVGLRDGHSGPGKESQEPSRVDLACSVTASVEERRFLDNYKYLALTMGVERDAGSRKDKKKGKKN